MTSDTLTFEIIIDSKEYHFGTDEKLVFEVYAKSINGQEQVAQIDFSSENQIRKEISQKMTVKEKLTEIELRLHGYKSGKIKFISPGLQMADINDLR